MTVTEAAVGYPDKTLARDISLILRRGECLGVIGPNGSGKTTFVKTILGKLPALSGEVRWGAKVQIGYYAQQLEDLDDRNEIIMELRRVAPSSATAGELRSFLAKFLFSGDDVYKHVRDLSGGEKGRLALAKLIYSGVNVLVLDEPTNHLDIPSREALEEALEAYEGTIITISHDRYFLDRVATQILALNGAGDAVHYNGDYTEYHDWRAAKLRGDTADEKSKLASAIATARAETRSESPRSTDGPTGATNSNQSPAADGSRRRKGKLGSAVSTGGSPRVKIVKKPREPEVIEAEISALEKRIGELSTEMAKPEVARDITRLVRVNDDYQQADARLAELIDEWERAETTSSSSRR
jgi:ATP-binding cassette subfamily F protein 3